MGTNSRYTCAGPARVTDFAVSICLLQQLDCEFVAVAAASVHGHLCEVLVRFVVRPKAYNVALVVLAAGRNLREGKTLVRAGGGDGAQQQLAVFPGAHVTEPSHR